MIAPDFTESSLRALLETIKVRACSFIASRTITGRPVKPIYLRFDIDDDLRKAMKMADICYDYNINATFFILNTAKYWQSPGLMNELKFMQDSLGQEIGWHNNILTEWINSGRPDEIGLTFNTIESILDKFRAAGLTIRGSASHGDPLCRKLNYLNYEVFTECPRTQEAINFPPCSFTIPKVSMHDFGLEYEAYHVPYDLYPSDAGGRWNRMVTEADIASHDRIQILIHPQHWKI